jgi:hypothetical protein
MDIGGKRHELADQTLPASGASGSRAWTFNASRAWAGFLVALRDLTCIGRSDSHVSGAIAMMRRLRV